MDQRSLGETGHESSILTFGAIALDTLTQDGANRLVELVLDYGVNHFDVAPAYGTAEVKLGPKLREYRDDIFLGCKTKQRTKSGAQAELTRSLNRLGVDTIDLYQYHAVTQPDELDAITATNGARDAIQAAKDEGLIDHIGLTSHGPPDLIQDAMDRLELDTLMFPMNFVTMGDTDGRDYADVLARAPEEGIGTIGIKAFAKQTWPPESELYPDDRPYATWYEPFDTPDAIKECLNYALSQGVTTITNAGDPKLLPMILHAATEFTPLSEADQTALEEKGATNQSPVPTRVIE